MSRPPREIWHSRPYAELLAIQQETTQSMLSCLIDRCRERYLRAARLVEVDRNANGSFENLKDHGPIHLTPHQPGWSVLCHRYIAEVYDGQLQLFSDNTNHVALQWSQFVYWKLMPVLLDNDELVRNMLRAAGMIPCHDKAAAAGAILAHFRNMALPGAVAPDGPADRTE